jgi:hypothetical protein
MEERLLHFLEDSGYLGSLEASLGSHDPEPNNQHRHQDHLVPDDRADLLEAADVASAGATGTCTEELELDVDIDLVLLLDHCSVLGNLCLTQPLRFNQILSECLRWASLQCGWGEAGTTFLIYATARIASSPLSTEESALIGRDATATVLVAFKGTIVGWVALCCALLHFGVVCSPPPPFRGVGVGGCCALLGG